MDLFKCVKKLIIEEPFYGIFLLGLDKCYGDMCDTACVYRNGINTGLCVNKEFWDGLSDEMQMAVLIHECNHLLFKHLTMQSDFENKTRFNLASDCVCNSYIPILQKDPYIYPQKYNLESNKGAKYYYENLPEGEEDKFDQLGLDDHTSWKDFDNLSDAERKLIDNQIDYQVKNTVEHVQKMAGNIPGQFKDYIDGLFKQKPAVFN